MSRDHDTKRRRLLDATDDGPLISVDDGPLVSADEPDRRSLLKGSVATAAAALGLPLLGGCIESTEDRSPTADRSPTSSPTETRPTSEDELLDYYAKPEQVAQSVAANGDLIDAIDEIGLTDEARNAGLQVRLASVEEEPVAEHRLYFEADYGMVSVVMSEAVLPLAGSAHVVTHEERMGKAPFEWPDTSSELPDGRLVFKVDPSGWVDPVSGFDRTDEDIPYLECVNENLTDCAPTSIRGVDCEFVSCCGAFHSDCSTEIKEPCRADGPCEQACWRLLGKCQCIGTNSKLCT